MLDYIYQTLYNQESVDKQLQITFDGGMITNTQLYSENFELTESICSEAELRFGGCESSCIKFRVRNEFSRLKGKWLEVSQILNGNADQPMRFGTFKVDSDKTASDRRYRDIIAYDAMYDVLNTVVSKWYDNIIFPISIKDLRDLFFEYFKIEQEEIELPNDKVYAYGSETGGEITGADIIRDICELNGCFGKIGRDGIFHYVFLDDNTEYEISGSGRESLFYEDYDVQKIDRLQIQQTEADFDYYYGEGENTYLLRMRALQLGTSKEELQILAENLYNAISNITYKPVNIHAIGNPCFETGDRISTANYEDDKISSFILERKLVGIQSLKDNYIAEGSETYIQEASPTSTAIYNTNREIAAIYKNNFYAYVFSNSQRFEILEIKKTVIEFNISATSGTDAIFIATIPFFLDRDGYIGVEYYKDAALITTDSVKAYFERGYNILTLTNYLNLGENARLTLTVKIGTEFVESDTRIHDAEIQAFKKYIDSGTYEAAVVDTTVPGIVIEKNAIKAAVFAKGLSTGNKWDGTINLTDEFNKFAITKTELILRATSDNVSIGNQIPTASKIVETVALFSIENGVSFTGISDEMGIDRVVRTYTVETAKQATYIFDRSLVTYDDSFALRSEFIYKSSEQEIDSGRMCSVTIQTDDKASVEGVVVNG